MEVLNDLIRVISVDFDLNNNSTPVAYKASSKTDKHTENDLNRLVIDMLNSFKEWKFSIEFIESQCALHDFKDVKVNGFRSVFKINLIAIKRVNQKLCAKELELKHLIKSTALSRLLTKINNKIKESYERDREFKENLTNNNNNKTDESKDKMIKPFTSNNLFISEISIELFEFYDSLEQDLVDYFRYHPLFFFRKDLRRAAKALVSFCSMSSSLPSSLVYSNKKKSKVMAAMLNNPTLSFPFAVINQIDCSPYNDVMIPIKYLNDGIATKTVYLPRQYRFLLNDLNTCLNTDQYLTMDNSWSYDLLSSSKSSKTEMIRVRIIKAKSKPKNKTVMFHVHGGAFVFHSPECHEIYTREFAKKLPEVVIISVAYRTGEIYPKAQQDVLDAYLWLTSGLDEVNEVIGFQPEKILLCGDSAGAFFNFTLAHLLVDFNKEIEKENLLDKTLKFPDAIFNFYGYYNLTSPSPALYMSCLDFFLPASHMKIAFGSLIWGVEKPKFKKRVFFPWFADKKKRWYNSRENADLVKEMIKVFESVPYLSSIAHFDFDSMKVPLYLVSSEMDLCVDHNVDLAARWKGDVTMLVLDDLIHGFLQLEVGDKTIKQDISKACELLRTAVDKL